MLNIKEEIGICLLRKGYSMRKIIRILKEKGSDIPCSSALSVQFTRNRVRFNVIQEILDFLGYELVIREKKN